MAIQYKVSNEGVVYDVKMIAEPKSRRNYNINYYYAKTKKLCKCNYCGKLITTQSGMTKHLMAKKCLKAQALRNRMEIDTQDRKARCKTMRSIFIFLKKWYK